MSVGVCLCVCDGCVWCVRVRVVCVFFVWCRACVLLFVCGVVYVYVCVQFVLLEVLWCGCACGVVCVCGLVCVWCVCGVVFVLLCGVCV